MAKNDALSPEQNAVIRGQRTACELWPADATKRQKMIAAYLKQQADERAAVAKAKEQAKAEIGADATKKRLMKKHGWEKVSLDIISKLQGVEDVEKRARCARQVYEAMKDEGMLVPELFDEAAFGVGTADEAGETAGFDRTSEGKRRGGAAAEPRTTEQMAASHADPAPTPGIPLDEAERRLEEYRAKNPPKAGRKPKELKELEAAVEAARAAEQPTQEGEGEGPADLPEAKPGEVTEALREGAAESEAHIREQVAGPGAPPPPPEEPAAAPEKPKRASRKKVEAAPPPPPPAPEPEDAEEDDSIPIGPAVHRPEAIGDQPSTYRAG